jgi:hypothetical protein
VGGPSTGGAGAPVPRVCRRLTFARIEAADTAGAIEVARRWAEADPLEDEAHHHTIELLAQTGRRTEALHHYGAYRDLIARELEVEPLEETLALVARIREGSAADDAPEPAHLGPARRDPAGVASRPRSGSGLGQPGLAGTPSRAPGQIREWWPRDGPSRWTRRWRKATSLWARPTSHGRGTGGRR